ncbi:uncharacterized protein LOC108732471 isoform X2 [Agrilus planipennis]|uniref:Uncharacterized protein LOC108732471 isoform X2 n=1 Tax=Agrilus planipennis TaxID=224129 RepID=A0A1W4WFL7_AGRPL|nr:uncharacterized protein LOC108732471 isoform X2 [Agrilus planipennis]
MKLYEETQIKIKDSQNDKLTLEVFDSESGYFKSVIHPMLAPGHEVELINWLKLVGIIPQRQTCQGAGTSDKCRRPMSWEPTKGLDNFTWKCAGCHKRKGIRENSVFHDIKCTFKDAIRSVLGWSKGTDSDTISKILNVRKHVVISTFNLCSRIANSFIEKHKAEWQLGGPGVIVLVLVYPEGCAEFTKTTSSSSSHTPILCLAEVKDVPPRYWFHSLNRYYTTDQEELANKTAMETIRKIVRPGSILVCNYFSSVCSLQSLQPLRDSYPTIVSTLILSQFDNERVILSKNLETIWATALRICEEAQLCNLSEVPDFLINQMWRQRFGSESFEVLINQFFVF